MYIPSARRTGSKPVQALEKWNIFRKAGVVLDGHVSTVLGTPHPVERTAAWRRQSRTLKKPMPGRALFPCSKAALIYTKASDVGVALSDDAFASHGSFGKVWRRFVSHK